MKKGSHQSLEAKEKVSKGLKAFFTAGGKVWNKGKKFSTRTEPSAKTLRRDKDYYLAELERNAKRGIAKRYIENAGRREEIKEARKKVQEATGAGRKSRAWKIEELGFIEENYKNMSVLHMALHLERSWSSVEHKLNRMKLTTYHRWKGVSQ